MISKDKLPSSEGASQEPFSPPAAPASDQLPRGLFTVIVAERSDDRRRRRALRRTGVPIHHHPSADRERALIRDMGHLLDRPGLVPADEMKQPEFKLLEGVDAATAEKAAAAAVARGFTPRIAHDPHIRFSRRRGQFPLTIGAAIFATTTVAFLEAMSIAPMIVLAQMALMMLIGVGLMWKGRQDMTLHPALPQLAPGKTLVSGPAPAPQIAGSAAILPEQASALPEQNAPLPDVVVQVGDRLDQLHAAVDANAELMSPPSLSALQARVAEMDAEYMQLSSSVETLEALLADGGQARLVTRLRRLESLQANDEALGSEQRAQLSTAVENLTARLRAQDVAVARAAMVRTDLLMLGAAAVRMARQVDEGWHVATS